MDGLESLFEFDEPLVEVVNISSETPQGLTVNQRVQYWLKQNERNYYIGRGSIFGNLFSHLVRSSADIIVENREKAIEEYEKWILTKPDLLSRLEELKNKRLGCWCLGKYKTCHGLVIAKLVYQKCQKLA